MHSLTQLYVATGQSKGTGLTWFARYRCAGDAAALEDDSGLMRMVVSPLAHSRCMQTGSPAFSQTSCTSLAKPLPAICADHHHPESDAFDAVMPDTH